MYRQMCVHMNVYIYIYIYIYMYTCIFVAPIYIYIYKGDTPQFALVVVCEWETFTFAAGFTRNMVYPGLLYDIFWQNA